MPYNEVPGKFKDKALHSGSKSGPLVKSRDQMLAIMLSEKKRSSTKPEYKPSPLSKALGKKSS